ncbi:Hypothetical predicted protein [Paramuricea clavata]|uniref:Uncharacterized protein n=1 Tax=Paramuricea clavata TaxID=317549 RepID=A0A6S7JCZ6_PARCT|nr:Hypothetical predicted protein [Paramuricea clavata]
MTPQTTTRPPAQVTGTSTTSSNLFQIQSSGYNKCLTASYVSRRGVYRRTFNGKRYVYSYHYVVATSVALSLSGCYISKQQSWRWTSDGRLQSDLNQQCLAVTRDNADHWYPRKIYGASLQPCNSTTSDQGWVCNGGFLKLKNKNLYLIPYIYTGNPDIGGIVIRSSVTNSCLWARYGTSKSLCGNAPRTTPTPTAQVTSKFYVNFLIYLVEKNTFTVPEPKPSPAQVLESLRHIYSASVHSFVH